MIVLNAPGDISSTGGSCLPWPLKGLLFMHSMHSRINYCTVYTYTAEKKATHNTLLFFTCEQRFL